MPKLNHTGPDGHGSKTGRKLGTCHKNYDELLQMGELGKGLGKQRHSINITSEGHGKRLNYYKSIENS